MRSPGRRIALFTVPLAVSWLVRLWFATCRIREHDGDRFRKLQEGERPIIGTCWHYCVLGIFMIFRRVPAVLMISASQDGEYLARMAERLGFSVVRGSSNYKGTSAAKELIGELRRGKNGGLIADGSQGPARIAQSGAVLLAARTGGIILPLAYSATRYFTFKTWDRLILPKPFSRIDVFYGEPFAVPADLKTRGMEEYRLRLEEQLNALYRRSWQEQGKEEH